MTRQPLVPTDIANRLVGSALSESSNHEAAYILGIKSRTADRIVKKYYETGSVVQHSGSRRKPIVTAWMRRYMIDLAKKNRRMKFKDIGKQLNPKISASLGWRILKAAGFARKKARKVIYLTEEQKKKRIEWARKFEDWGSEDWAWVIWSDKVYVVLGDRKHTVFVMRNPQEEFPKDCVIPKFKQSNLRIMAWSCIMKGKKGPLVVLDYPGGRGGGMTAVRYQEQVLEKVVHHFHQEANEERGWVSFEQDGAPLHTVKSTIKWLERNLVETMPQPAGSPDIVPIEALWHTLKKIIRAHSHIPTTLNKLKITVSKAWNKIPLEEIDKHLATMNERVQAVMAADWGHTKY